MVTSEEEIKDVYEGRHELSFANVCLLLCSSESSRTFNNSPFSLLREIRSKLDSFSGPMNSSVKMQVACQFENFPKLLFLLQSPKFAGGLA